MRLFIALFVFFCVSFISYNSFADSLWKESYFERGSLFTDNKACTIGDIVTIVITETVQSKRTSETSTNKDVSNKGKITDWLYPAAVSMGFLEHKDNLPQWEYDMEKDFKGGGAIKEDDSFIAKITARVIDVLPNGNLLIEGSRDIMVTNDRKTIIISGIIRKSDISDTNTIESSQVADAKVYYEGSGPLTDNQKRGIFTYLRDIFSMF